MIKVLIISSELASRKNLVDIFSKTKEFEIIGSISGFQEVLNFLEHEIPDLILSEIEFPNIDPVSYILEIKKRANKTCIFVISNLTIKGSMLILDLLTAGASTYIQKPKDLNTLSFHSEEFSRIIYEKINKHFHLNKEKSFHTDPILEPPINMQEASSDFQSIDKTKINVLAIGASTGGPDAILKVLRGLSHKLKIPIFITQHMPPVFTKNFSDRLFEETGFPTKEAQNNEPVIPGHVYVAPGDFHMEVEKKLSKITIKTHKGPLENSCRPSVDVMFRSISKVYGNSVLAVILTGMGKDGMEGARIIKNNGGEIYAQDKQSSIVWGMPGFIVNSGLANIVLPLDLIAGTINNRILL